jgi:hypothetical protein
LCRIPDSGSIAAAKLFHTLIDTITTHPSCPPRSSQTRQVEWINLYFFPIVKEHNSLFDPTIKPKSACSGGLRFEVVVEVDGIEPTTPCLQSRCSPS